jgi:uncharacterized protein (TIGR02246 family)
MTDDEKEIRKLIDTWMKATKAGDIDTVLTLMTDDVVFLVAGAPPFGKKEFGASSAEHASKSLEFEGHCEILEIKIVGDHAYIINKLSVTMNEPGGKRNSRSGHTLTIFRKDNGKWLLARDANLLVPDRQ